MKLTPLDIKRQEFKTTFRGYDPLEVETFLEMVANEYEELQNERNQVKNEILTLQTQLKDYQQVEQTLKQTLMNAQESITRERTNTEKEANLILHEAELKAEKILEKARRDLERMKNELVLVRAQKESFAKRLRHLLESQIELIKVLEIDDTGLDEPEVIDRNKLQAETEKVEELKTKFESSIIKEPELENDSELIEETGLVDELKEIKPEPESDSKDDEFFEVDEKKENVFNDIGEVKHQTKFDESIPDGEKIEKLLEEDPPPKKSPFNKNQFNESEKTPAEQKNRQEENKKKDTFPDDDQMVF